ncbi:ABC transporter ATP-binding protein/permease [Sporomusa acidovorans]|uniref:Vitamin B12 transport ATP-binding protein BacA n=1 Tax=Sporomusa acidovorans (strain ATCC 49682 / DSM 3132 / Mol) TaxID=1123286 RepID=A0ABZ3J9S6_SPOA4|nr:ABC transporter ATP-binding protein/permease [Sporomusa acidovorans]OZC21736.1 vitamin B12 transport ATP-binding protein BacA [Sporomusa acidovorans DSM 3132]SDD58754.1 putative ATP-binding cassette transporter [Sporomusa acidovorans]
MRLLFAKTKSFFHEAEDILRPYWQSAERWRSGAIVAGILALIGGQVYMSVLFNNWWKDFFNAIQAMNYADYIHQLMTYALLALLTFPLEGCQNYFQGILQLRWRRWLTEDYIGQWMFGKNYYNVQQIAGDVDNPDQRIAEDLRLVTEDTIALIVSFVHTSASLLVFSSILWNSPGTLKIGGITIPGAMLWLAAIYALAGSWINHLLGKILAALNRRQQRFEADYRFSLMRVRENAETISAYYGEQREECGLAERFAKIMEAQLGIINRKKIMDWFFRAYFLLAELLPYLILAPLFIADSIRLGDMQQTAMAFVRVRMSFWWFMMNYEKLAKWKATIDRLIGFKKAMAQTAALQSGEITRQQGPLSEGIRIARLDLWLPDGQPLLQNITFAIPPASRMLITGPSGCGKTTLFHALNGMWPFGCGSITVPAKGRLLFIPQKLFVPIATLRQALVYPDASGDYCPDSMKQTLAAVGLPHLTGQLDTEQHWQQQLSPGEQQRLAFARALLIKPQWLFLDEATAALDEAAETQLYQLLLDRLPGTAIISIAHRPSLLRFHDQQLELIKWMATIG